MPRRLPADKKKRGLAILAIQKGIEATFSESDWKELGYLTGTYEWIDSHPRLLRSLRWGDHDYAGHVLDAIEHILEHDPANLDALIENPKVHDWLSSYKPDALTDIGEPTAPIAQPPLAVSSAAVDQALKDAEVLIATSGPSSAVDRIHTALHGYLIALCDVRGIPYNPEPSLTALFKALRQHHPGLQVPSGAPAQVTQILNALANIVHVINELRNQASLAHPNQILLGPGEATVAINATRTVFAYLNSKCT